MSRIPLIVGNWKMNTARVDAVTLARSIAGDAPTGVDLAVCPPFPWLESVAAALKGSQVAVGAQNCWTEPSGAYTGEVAAPMLAGLCRFVIVGHSERRQYFEESDELVSRKAAAVHEAQLTPILCVGESLETRQAGNAVSFVRDQITRGLGRQVGTAISTWVVAYEPVWAIGTGVAATPADAEEMAAAIRSAILDAADSGVAETMRILYGGSVNAANAGQLLAGENVDGALVGGASLQAESFLAIAAAVAAAR